MLATAVARRIRRPYAVDDLESMAILPKRDPGGMPGLVIPLFQHG